MRTTKALVAVASLVATAGIAVPSAQAASTTTRYVSPKGSDTGTCSAKKTPCKTISYAATQAASGNTIRVAAGHYAESVAVPVSITIVGAGATKTVITGNGSDPGLALGTQTTSTKDTVRDLSVSHVKGGEGGIVAENVRLTVTGIDADYDELAGLAVLGGSLTASKSSFSHALVTSSTPLAAGVIAGSAPATITDSTMDDNAFIGVASSEESSAAASHPSLRPLLAAAVQGRPKAAAAAKLTLSVRDSSVSGNKGPGVVAAVPTSLTDDTIADNSGAGIYVAKTKASLLQVTITGTTKYTGTTALQATGAIVSVTSGSGGGTTAAPKQVTIAGSIDAANEVPDCNTAVRDHGWNLSSDKSNSCKLAKKNHDLIKTSPKLGSLGHHGGFARTVLPAKGSPAINAVPLKHAGCVKGATDERGVKRPQPTGGRCDIGSVELVQKKKK